MSEDAMTKLDTAYCDANRAKAAYTKQVHSQFTFMEKKEGGAGVQLPTAVCAASTANTLYWCLNSRNSSCKSTAEAVWQCWQQREDEEQLPAYYVKGMAALTQAGMALTAKIFVFLNIGFI
jgi:hypothetical protein